MTKNTDLLYVFTGISSAQVINVLSLALNKRGDVEAKVAEWLTRRPVESLSGFLLSASVAFYLAEREVNPKISDVCRRSLLYQYVLIGGVRRHLCSNSDRQADCHPGNDPRTSADRQCTRSTRPGRASLGGGPGADAGPARYHFGGVTPTAARLN